MYLITYLGVVDMKKFLMTLSLILVLVLAACGSDKGTSNETVDEEKKTIEVDETVTAADYTAKVQRVKVEDDVLTVVFDWENQSDWDPAHFELLGIVEVTQNGEALQELDNDRKYEQIKHGSFDVYDLKYKLIDDSDVTIRIMSTNEHDDSEGTITVSLE